jgi:predicted membrane-bound spermidine synthase
VKLSWDGPLPQVELGPHLGGAKTLFMRSGIVTRLITMFSAMSAAWSTSHTLRSLFLGSFVLFVAAALVAMCTWMVIDYTLILPSEQAFRQGQAHREERSPLKRDHDEMKRQLEALQDD